MSNRCMLILNNKDYLVPPLRKENGKLYTVQEKVIEAYYLGRERELDDYYSLREPCIDMEEDGSPYSLREIALKSELCDCRGPYEKEVLAALKAEDYDSLSTEKKNIYRVKLHYARITDKVDRAIENNKSKWKIPDNYYVVSNIWELMRIADTLDSLDFAEAIDYHFINANPNDEPITNFNGIFIPNITEEQERKIYNAVNAESQSLVIKPTTA